MAIITSHTGLEALNFEIGGISYRHYAGGSDLSMTCTLQNPARPEQTCEIGDVWTGPDFAESLRKFDFSEKAFHYTFDFNWENESDNAGWWIRKPARRATVDVEFVFLRSFHWSTEDEEEEEEEEDEGDEDGEGNDPLQWVVEEITHYIKPIQAAQAQFPSLKLGISVDGPVKRNGVIGCVSSPKKQVRRILASAPDHFVMVESRARITAERAEFDRFIEALRQEISAAEQEFFDKNQAMKTKAKPPVSAPPVRFEWPPTDRYQDHGDGTVTDVQTGLQWMRFSLGQEWQEWQESTCVGKAKKYQWQEALDAATELNAQGGYAGHADWRVPTKEELLTLVYCSCGQPTTWNNTGKACEGDWERPTIYQPMFPNTSDSMYWSSSTVEDKPDCAWYIGFVGGYANNSYKHFHQSVRLMRGIKAE